VNYNDRVKHYYCTSLRSIHYFLFSTRILIPVQYMWKSSTPLLVLDLHFWNRVARYNRPMSQAKNVFVVILILLPLALMGILQYAPQLKRHPKVSSLSILPPHNYGPKQYDRLVDEIPQRFGRILSATPGMQVRRTPLPLEVGEADRDLVKLSNTVGGADALVMTTINVDEALVELTVEVVDTRTKNVLFNETLSSPLDRVDQMVDAAGAAVRSSVVRNR